MAKPSKKKPARKPSTKRKPPSKREQELKRQLRNSRARERRLEKKLEEEKRQERRLKKRLEEEKRQRKLERVRHRAAKKGLITKHLHMRSRENTLKEEKQRYTQTAEWQALADLARKLGYSTKKMRDELFSPGAKGKRK
jgi:hypothetical protein